MSTTLGEYELKEIVGTGGMSVVWRAQRAPHEVPVALKVMTRRSAGDEPVRQALREEVRAAARLHHPGIVVVLDVGTVDPNTSAAKQGLVRPGDDFFVMEYIDGPTLGEYPETLAWSEVRNLLLRLLDALAHAHARDVIHRDLKPSNILLARDDEGFFPKISDFGIARVLSSETTRHTTVEDRITGTPNTWRRSRSRAGGAIRGRGRTSMPSDAWPID